MSERNGEVHIFPPQAPRDKAAGWMIKMASAGRFLKGVVVSEIAREGISQRPVNFETPVIYLPSLISPVAKLHQVEGTQFMLREIVTAPTREGCVLAHIMGAGKTIQVIALLLSYVPLSYHMFRELMDNSDRKLSIGNHEEVKKCLLHDPHTIVADEALLLAIPQSRRVIAYSQFKTKSRIGAVMLTVAGREDCLSVARVNPEAANLRTVQPIDILAFNDFASALYSGNTLTYLVLPHSHVTSARYHSSVMANGTDVPDTPKTPGPLFAFKAFRNIWAGTPNPTTDDELTAPIRSIRARGYQRSDNILERAAQTRSKLASPQLSRPQQFSDVNGSPTKGILWTPGTTSKFRKTVSFGAGVGDNEPKMQVFANQRQQENRPPGNKELRSAPQPAQGREPLLSNSFEAQNRINMLRVTDDEVTVDLTEPHSQSGIFWKNEYDNFKAKTLTETRKLVEYRTAAKAFVRKQAEQVNLLTLELQKKNAIISDLQTQVRAVQILQVQKDETEYKRQLQEQHRRHVEDQAELARKDAELESMSKRLLEAEKATRMKSDPADGEGGDGDAKSRHTALARCEQKAAELETENRTLKRMLARVKAEMSNYEDRRKAKEGQLKNREAKLVNRLDIYKMELKNTKQRCTEDTERLIEEKQAMQDTIDALRMNLAKVPMSQRGMLMEDIDLSMKEYRERKRQNKYSSMDALLQDLEADRSSEDDSAGLPTPPEAPHYVQPKRGDEDGKDGDKDEMPIVSLGKQLSCPTLEDVAQTPRTTANSKANLRRFARPAMSPSASFTPQGPASAKKAAMSSQRVRAAEARLRIRSRRGV
ncbi:hypothetical protein KEM54_001251 [Ascosphaera aggregata]|nr:hypothetical protein KEM54_001251 [Ascosphaera aggregata]